MYPILEIKEQLPYYFRTNMKHQVVSYPQSQKQLPLTVFTKTTPLNCHFIFYFYFFQKYKIEAAKGIIVPEPEPPGRVLLLQRIRII